jgi:voltage-gated potassium channel
VLAFLLSLFSIGVFGYITATLASFFVERSAASQQGSVGGSADIRAVRRELAALRRDLAMRAGSGQPPSHDDAS